MKHTFPLFVLSLIATTIVHAEVFPGPHYVEEPDPYASPYAEVGGTLTYAGSNSPQSLNCFIDNNTFSHMVFGLLYPTLLGSDAVTDELAPSIAKQWEISEDKCTFTFTLDERAKWSDNNIYTARDVKKTFDTIKNPYCSNPYRVVLSQISSPEILDDCTIRFKASEIHWQNIYKIGANIYIMPYRFIEKKENEVRNDETVYNRLKNEAEQDAKKVDELYKEIEKSAENFHLTNEEHKQQLSKPKQHKPKIQHKPPLSESFSDLKYLSSFCYTNFNVAFPKSSCTHIVSNNNNDISAFNNNNPNNKRIRRNYNRLLYLYTRTF
jgi:ABC-type transport system substrate-binding protein